METYQPHTKFVGDMHPVSGRHCPPGTVLVGIDRRSTKNLILGVLTAAGVPMTIHAIMVACDSEARSTFDNNLRDMVAQGKLHTFRQPASNGIPRVHYSLTPQQKETTE